MYLKKDGEIKNFIFFSIQKYKIKNNFLGAAIRKTYTFRNQKN